MAVDIRLGFLWMKFGWIDVSSILIFLPLVKNFMRFIFIYFIFTSLIAFSQNKEINTWDSNFNIENISADSSDLKIYTLSFFPISVAKNTNYLMDDKYVVISRIDSLNYIRTVMIKGEDHSHVFTTLDGEVYYEKSFFSDLGFQKYDKSSVKETFPPFKFLGNKQLGPFHCDVNEINLPEQNFKATLTSTNDIQIANQLTMQIPISAFQKLGFLLDFEMDLKSMKIKINCNNFKSIPIENSIFSISSEGAKEMDSHGEMKLARLMFGPDYLSIFGDEK